MPSFKKRGVDIFRPIAAVARCATGDSAEPRGMQCSTNIFRRKGRGVSSGSSDESIVVSFPADVWPPPEIPGSESTESKSMDRHKHNLDRSAPVQNHSDDHGTPNRREFPRSKTPPSYYKIEMQGSVVQLSAGDDSSVHIEPDHNNRIKLAGAKSRNIIRASPINEHVAESPSSTSSIETGHKWSISESGRIVKLNPPPHLPHFSKSVAARPGQPKSVKLSDKLRNTGGTTESTPPLLARLSTDSLSSGSSNEFLPESPPRMTRSAMVPSLFQEDASRSTASKHSKTSSNRKNRTSISSNSTNSVPRSRGCGARLDFMSLVIDFFSMNCCQATVSQSNRCSSLGRQRAAVA